jgi:hypothetical protein
MERDHSELSHRLHGAKRYPCMKLGLVAHTHNASTWEAEEENQELEATLHYSKSSSPV